jgi:pimeloyl-ACP methyl ester carboxylesterase
MENQKIKGGTRGGYAPVNGLNLYYESYGPHSSDIPLILLHGGLGNTEMFAQLLPQLSQSRQVIAVDLQGHGHTADVDRAFSFESMADDISALIQYLRLSSVDIGGYSLGGGVALQTAIRHPGLIRKLVLISTPCKQTGWYAEVLQGMAAMNAAAAQALVGSPPHTAYVSVAPNPENWPALVGKTGELLKQEYNWCAEFAEIQAPVQFVFADADSIRPEHMVEMFQLSGGGKTDAGWDGSRRPKSRLAILPGTTHYDIVFNPLLATMLNQFLGEIGESD